MARRYYANAAPQLTLSSAITASSLSAVVATNFTGWPATYPFFASLDLGTASAEIVSVTGITGPVATIVRGQDGTAAVSHAAGATLDQVVIRQDLDEANAHINATLAVHGITDTSALVVTTDTRLSNARTPTAHAATHGTAGSDPVSLDAGQIATGSLNAARLAASGVTAGAYTNANITVDAAGRVTVAANGTGGGNALRAIALDPSVCTSTSQVGTNNTFYHRILSPGSWSVSSIGFVVTNVAGNVSVAVLRDNGSNAPGVLAAQSASVACPALGPAAVALGSTITVNGGDWLAISSSSIVSFLAQVAGATLPSWRSVQGSQAPGAVTSNPVISGTGITKTISLWGQ